MKFQFSISMTKSQALSGMEGMCRASMLEPSAAAAFIGREADGVFFNPEFLSFHPVQSNIAGDGALEAARSLHARASIADTVCKQGFCPSEIGARDPVRTHDCAARPDGTAAQSGRLRARGCAQWRGGHSAFPPTRIGSCWKEGLQRLVRPG